MKLKDLLREVTPTRMAGPGEADITGVCYDSRKAAPGCLFVAVRGFRSDGHAYIPAALEQGAAALLVEMVCVIGKPLNEILREIKDTYGHCEMSEFDTHFSFEKKDELNHTLFVEKQLPDFGIEIDKVSYADGCKVYFKNGGWIICRFSGTEPLIRIFCEMETYARAVEITGIMRNFLGL